MRSKKRDSVLFTLILVFSLFKLADAENFTLSNWALMQLDWNHASTYSQQQAMVTSKKEVQDGVEFTIHFPSNTGDCSGIEWISSVEQGNGTLTGIDISRFDAFELKFKLLSINGLTATDISKELVVGAIVSYQGTWAYKAESVVMRPGYNLVTSTTQTSATILKDVGFAIDIPYWWYDVGGNPWNAAGSDVKILVSPVAGDYALTPEPLTISLFALAGLMLRNRNK
jgi:hypothetical protein